MNAPYLIIPIGITLITLYILSWFLSKLGILTRSFHRKFWNWLLLATFLLSAVLGIIMVIQINNKLNIPGTEKILKWHVNFGIALSLIGLFHFLWHWKYYLPSKRMESSITEKLYSDIEELPRSFTTRLFPFLIGYVSLLTQTLLIREFLALFHGNELNVAFILFIWLLFTGIGAFLGKSAKAGTNTNRLITLTSVLTFLPLFTLLMPRLLYPALILPGVETTPLVMVGIVSLCLLAFCLIGGFSFTYITRLLPKQFASRLYSWESLGGALAGLVLSLIIYINFSEQVTFLVAIIPIVLLWTLMWFKSRRPIITLSPALAWMILLVVFLALPIEKFIDGKNLPNQELVKSYHGTTGKMTVTRTEDQLNLYINGIIAETSDNLYFNEEIVHFSMAQRPDASSVLIIGGTVTGIDHELSKYPVKKITFVESDPIVARIARQFHFIEDHVIPRIIYTDGYRLIRKDTSRYDMILAPLPGPYTLNLNRFYTDLFFRSAKKRLHPNGCLMITLPGTVNYVSGEAEKLISSVILAANTEFTTVALFPGESTYLIATDGPITTHITSILDSLGIENRYLNSDYFDEELFTKRVVQLNQTLPVDAIINTANRPMAFLYQLKWWMNQYSPWLLLLPGLGVFLLLASGLWSKKPGLSGMFLMGATGSGFEMIILILLQTSIGSMYQMTGILLATFMVGLAIGSRYGFIRSARKAPLVYGPLMAGASLITSLVAIALSNSDFPNPLVLTILFILNIIGAFLVGGYYKAMVHSSGNYSAKPGTVYAYDLLGAALGALVFPIIFIPMVGVSGTALLLAMLGILTLGIGYLQNRWIQQKTDP